MPGDELRLLVARGERDQHARHETRGDPHPEEPRSVVGVEPLEGVVGAHGRHHEGGRDHAGRHRVSVLGDGPRVQQKGPEVAEDEGAVGGGGVAHRMLHEGVRADDEVAGEPAADEEREGGQEVPAPPEAPLPEHQQPEEARLQEEREQAFHRERVSDDASGVSREVRPVGAELELHRDAGDDADGEVDAEDADPEARGPIPPAVAGAEAESLHQDDEQGQAHRQLRKQVVEDDGEGELQPVPEERVGHAGGLRAVPGSRQGRRVAGPSPAPHRSASAPRAGCGENATTPVGRPRGVGRRAGGGRQTKADERARMVREAPRKAGRIAGGGVAPGQGADPAAGRAGGLGEPPRGRGSPPERLGVSPGRAPSAGPAAPPGASSDPWRTARPPRRSTRHRDAPRR